MNGLGWSSRRFFWSIDCNFTQNHTVSYQVVLSELFDHAITPRRYSNSKFVESCLKFQHLTRSFVINPPGLGSHFVGLGNFGISTSGSCLSSEKDGRSSTPMDICAKLITTRHGRREGSNHPRVGFHVLKFRVESAVILTLTKPAIIGRNPDLWFQ